MAATLSADDRKKLVNDNLSYVRALASEISRKLPQEILLDDLIAYGNKGLVEAAERYDPTRGASFTTFSYYRIRGAIYDGLRHMSWFGRSEASPELRFEANANDLLSAAAERDAKAQAQNPGKPPLEQQLMEVSNTFANLSMVFISSLASFEPIANVDQMDDDDVPRARLAKAMAALPEREREVIRLHYAEDLDLNEVGQRLGLSRSWTSRIHSRAIELLRTELERR